VQVSDLPEARGDGSPFTSYINLSSGTQIVSYYAGSGDELIFISMASGNGFLANLSDMFTSNKAGKGFVGVDDKFEGGDLVLPLHTIREGMGMIACLSSSD
jgi:topoisomerase-4 subunit A